LKKAINTEKAILRQRLNRIKVLGSAKLKNTHSCAQQLYAELEDLYIYTEKVEKKAIFGLAKIFRRSIENEQRIEYEVQIKHVEVTQTERIRNFEKQKVHVPSLSLSSSQLGRPSQTVTSLFPIFMKF
jgi:hypothetical protein